MEGVLAVGQRGLLFLGDEAIIYSMLKAMKYRLKPAKNQAQQLESQLEECRWLYNVAIPQSEQGLKDCAWLAGR